ARLEPHVGVPAADRDVAAQLGGQLVGGLTGLVLDRLDGRLDVIALAFHLRNRRLHAVEGDGRGRGRRVAALDLAEGQRVGRGGEVVAGVGLDPKPPLLDGGLAERHVDGHALDADEARGVHAGDDGRLFAGLERVLEGDGAGAAAGDADAGDGDGAFGVV